MGKKKVFSGFIFYSNFIASWAIDCLSHLVYGDRHWSYFFVPILWLFKLGLALAVSAYSEFMHVLANSSQFSLTLTKMGQLIGSHYPNYLHEQVRIGNFNVQLLFKLTTKAWH